MRQWKFMKRSSKSDSGFKKGPKLEIWHQHANFQNKFSYSKVLCMHLFLEITISRMIKMCETESIWNDTRFNEFSDFVSFRITIRTYNFT